MKPKLEINMIITSLDTDPNIINQSISIGLQTFGRQPQLDGDFTETSKTLKEWLMNHRQMKVILIPEDDGS